MVAACILARHTRHRLPVALIGAAAIALVGFSRLYIGAHYPTDVLGSLLVSSSAIIFLTGLWHTWLLPRLHTIPVVSPLLARFGPLEVQPTTSQASPADGFGCRYRIQSSRRHRHAAR
ncbi:MULTISPECIES: phosphatase PAP2 family protein [unclassified Streptomyces]|uniref:phosphatase PAP2 family protein n=1 Tax=Streptomyces TaxID=1883 RepID=UPI0022AFC45A|nr:MULTISPECIES: phosphatase PAP2 family protein [unclassified Streptomyces]MCZ4103213.1 phosphatase PAP2 family protein [Streptomyces sp. H39-C1]